MPQKNVDPVASAGHGTPWTVGIGRSRDTSNTASPDRPDSDEKCSSRWERPCRESRRRPGGRIAFDVGDAHERDDTRSIHGQIAGTEVLGQADVGQKPEFAEVRVELAHEAAGPDDARQDIRLEDARRRGQVIRTSVAEEDDVTVVGGDARPSGWTCAGPGC